MVFPEILLNKGIMAKASNMASMQEMKAVKVDSLRNCVIKFLRSVPNTLRTPTSLALFAERAVVRFMKLMQAISKIKMATAEKIYTYCILPPGLSSKGRLEYK